jgi:hypothetical protein
VNAATLGTLVQPGWLAFLLVWNFAVLSAAQLTIRLIMAYSVWTTLVGAVALTLAALVVAALFDVATGDQASIATRLGAAPLAMALMALAGVGVARWILKIRRVRGQLIAGLMVGLLDPHLFTLLWIER